MLHSSREQPQAISMLQYQSSENLVAMHESFKDQEVFPLQFFFEKQIRRVDLPSVLSLGSIY